MTELIAFQTYRTERLQINGDLFTVQFTKRKGRPDVYALFAINDDTTKSWQCFYSGKTANEFEKTAGNRLEELICAVLNGDVDRGHAQPV